MAGVEEERISLRDFHGHLGPYVVVGYRMGKAARRILNAQGKRMRALVRIGPKPPSSCMLDGIQFSTQCTLGKGNIQVLDEGKAEAVFSTDREVTIRLRKEIRQMIDSQKAKDELWQMVSAMTDEELFEVE